MILVVAKSIHTRGNLEGQVFFPQYERQGLNVHKETNCSGIVACCVLQNSQERRGRRTDNSRDTRGDEKKNDQEDRTGHGSDNHTANHDLGAFSGWVRDFCGGQYEFLIRE